MILLCILLVGCALSQNPCQLPWPKDYIVYPIHNGGVEGEGRGERGEERREKREERREEMSEERRRRRQVGMRVVQNW